MHGSIAQVDICLATMLAHSLLSDEANCDKT